MTKPPPTSDSVGFVGVKRRALALGIPMITYLELTHTCNWRCSYCYNARRFDMNPLMREEWVRVLDELRVLGTLTLVLTGGEPLVHADFFEIAGAARERAFALKVFTNGSLVTEGIARQLADLRPQAVELSLHGATAATHDRSTGRLGAFDAMWRGVDRLARVGVTIMLKTTLTRLNETELDEIIALAARRGLPLRIDPTVTPRTDSDRSPLRCAPSRQGVERLMARLEEQGELPTVTRAEGGTNCGVGQLTMAIDPEGDVFPCIQWRRSALGNVRSTPLTQLWRTSSVRKEAADIARDANKMIMSLGGAAAGFPYCPALAEMLTGDPLKPHDEFLENAEAARVAVRRRLAQIPPEGRG
jgi:MoaA/NifB/PqqE/SkfB family radical SAM enzyme